MRENQNDQQGKGSSAGQKQNQSDNQFSQNPKKEGNPSERGFTAEDDEEIGDSNNMEETEDNNSDQSRTKNPIGEHGQQNNNQGSSNNQSNSNTNRTK
ncbi:hypothetical protein BH11BAC2_BH11BAC2_14200 [soil metagenome]